MIDDSESMILPLTPHRSSDDARSTAGQHGHNNNVYPGPVTVPPNSKVSVFHPSQFIYGIVDDSMILPVTVPPHPTGHGSISPRFGSALLQSLSSMIRNARVRH